MDVGAVMSGPLSIDPQGRRPGWEFLFRLAERLLGLTELNRRYVTRYGTQGSSRRFCDEALSILDAGVEVESDGLSRIPATGPLVVVANHPFGAIEGLALESAIAHVRPDVKVMGNFLLSRIPETREHGIFVDPYAGEAAMAANRRPMREAVEWLRRGHALIIFPAGEVAHLKLSTLRIAESSWSAHAARLARLSSATVLPAYFEGRAGWLFHALGLIHSRLRTAMMPRELLRQCGKKLALRIGSPIEPSRLASFADDASAASYLRLRSLLLGVRHPAPAKPTAKPTIESTIVAPVPVETIERELQALPAECKLLQSGDFAVYAIRAADAPGVLREIGRMREITFRQVGEGTGRPIDLDRFDEHYTHLVAWDRTTKRLVGAYRIGFTDEIFRDHGLRGLYTHTLFHFGPELLDELGAAAELGRSFVAAEYQRSYAALLLLWKGIARVVSRRPRCRRLFGVVSISAEYDSMTQRLLMSFLRLNKFNARLAELVRPRTPPKLRRHTLEREMSARTISTLDEVDELIEEIEAHQRRTPILLRQYLKLNGTVLGFNVDPDFGNVLDALMLVDLAKVDRPTLDRFFGASEAKALLDRHATETQSTIEVQS